MVAELSDPRPQIWLVLLLSYSTLATTACFAKMPGESFDCAIAAAKLVSKIAAAAAFFQVSRCLVGNSASEIKEFPSPPTAFFKLNL